MSEIQAVRRCLPTLALLMPLLLPAIFTGCAVSPIQDESTILAPLPRADLDRATALEAQGKSAEAAKLYQELSEKAQPPARAQLRIKSAQAYLDAGETAQAKQTLDAIPQPNLTAGQRELLLLTRADLALATGRPKDAIVDLERMRARGLPESMQAQRLGTLAAAQRLGNDPVAAAETLGSLDKLLNDQGERLANQVSIVSTLSLLSQPQLQQLTRQGRGAMKGWADIALLTQQSGADPKGLDASYRQWQQRHRSHPALPGLGRAYADTLTGGYQPGDKITVMLPRSGRFASAAKVIRNGIEAASRADAGGQRPTLAFVDSTNTRRVKNLHATATKQGADYLIGPLEKPAVDSLLATRTLSAPTLALNEASRDGRAENLFQFSLSPENEAAEVASKAAAMGAKRALLLYPKGDWGERLASAFRRQWSSLGGTVSGQASFDPSWSTYDKTLAKLIDGKDADMLFLVATTEMARKVYPQIRSATPLPVISTSHVYSGGFDPVKDQALIGLYFVDIPWMLDTGGSDSRARRALAGNASSAKGPLARLYAMGIDAYRLAPRLSALANSQGAYYPGQTGGLALDPLGRITRQLMLGRFSENGPRPADSLTDAPQTQRQ